MRLFRVWTFVCCALACAIWCQAAWAAAENDKAAVDKKAADEKERVEKAVAPKEEAPAEAVREEKVLERALPVLKPKDIAMPVPKRASQAQAKSQAMKKRAGQPAGRRPNAPFWSPRSAGLSAGATYRLESMGRHVHLSPAMRFHLNRSGGTANVSPSTRLSPTASVPGQESGKFYPGVSRLPTQKPFTNIERPPTGLERYWPLLLEGRQDPNTGLIIWTLP